MQRVGCFLFTRQKPTIGWFSSASENEEGSVWQRRIEGEVQITLYLLEANAMCVEKV